MANCHFCLLMLACHLLWLQPWPEISFVDACVSFVVVAFTFPDGYYCQRAMMNMSYLSLGLVRIMQISQENGQNPTNTDTGKEREYKSRENAIKGQQNSTLGQY
ncbi:hypothetical protein Tco_1088311 [Tanacetum coccineum]